MKFENTHVYNMENAIRGMRFPMQSEERSDTKWYDDTHLNERYCHYQFIDYDHESLRFLGIGEKDLELAQKLIKAGSVHRKFLRQILVSVDITAPLYWWKEFDTYKVGTVANSESTMHRLASTPITLDCFETDDYEPILSFESGIDDDGDTPYTYDVRISDVIGTHETEYYYGETYIGFLESLRQKYLETKDKRYWKELIRWLPSSWLQKRAVTMNYETLFAICSKDQRRNHKLTEWSESFIKWAKSLPYAREFLFIDEVEK